MASKKSRFTFTTRIIGGGIILLLLAFVIINFGNLTISDPFVDRNFGFQALDLSFKFFQDAPEFRIVGGTDPRTSTSTSTSSGTTSSVTTSSGTTSSGTTTSTSSTGGVITTQQTTPFNSWANLIQQKDGGYPFVCKLKINTTVKLKDGGTINLNSDFQQESPLLGFSVASTSGKIIDTFTTEPRITCDVILSKDGQRLPYKVKSSNLLLTVESFNQAGVRFLTKQNSIGLGEITIDDQPTRNLFIGTERPFGNKITTTATEIENKLGGTTSFDARVRFYVTGSVFIELPYLTQQFGSPFVTRIDINQDVLANSMNLKILKGTTQVSGEPFLEITKVQPAIRSTSGKAGSVELVQVFTKLNNWNPNEGTPTCEAFRQSGLSQISGGALSFQPVVATGSSALKSSDGVNSFFECRLFIPADSPLGTYQVKAKTQSQNRPTTVSSFVFGSTSGITTDGTQDGGTPSGETRKCFDCQGTFIRSEPIDKACPFFECENGRTIGGTGGAPQCKSGEPARKLGSGVYTCQNDDGSEDEFSLFPKLVECPQGVSANPDKFEVCTPPFLIFLLTGFNLIWVGLGIIVLIIIIAIIASLLKNSGGGGQGYI